MSINPQCREPGSYQSLTLFFSEPDLASQASQKTFQGCAQTNSLYIHCGWIQFPEDSGSGIVTPQSYIWSPSAARDGTSSLDRYCFGRNYVGFPDFVFLDCSSGVGTSESPAILLAPCYPVTSQWCRQCTESYAYFSCRHPENYNPDFHDNRSICDKLQRVFDAYTEFSASIRVSLTSF